MIPHPHLTLVEKTPAEAARYVSDNLRPPARPIPDEHLQAIFAEQIDPDEAYREAVHSEIGIGLKRLVIGATWVVVTLYAISLWVVR